MEALAEKLNKLTAHHYEKCLMYRWYLKSVFPDFSSTANGNEIADLPWIPARAFKRFDLKSVDDSQVFKIMQSSGTSGKPSKIYLDRLTSKNQRLDLVNSVVKTLGKNRLPMLVVDTDLIVKDRRSFSARTAAINGFSVFARETAFALDENLNLQLDKVIEFNERNKGSPSVIFGFTFLVWQNLVRALESRGIELDFSKSFLLHGGGWKKLENEKVSNTEFKARVYKNLRCENVHNYYGMIEQTGAIYMECSKGYLHAPENADFIIRSKNSLEPLGEGEVGLVQVLSSIQTSYPGHSILTEDEGYYLGPQNCDCGSSGRVLVLRGRTQRAEIRGCSDAG